jgi:dUTP pyrophosphatase
LVDSGYRGELQVVLVNHDPEQDYAVSRGDRIAQLVLVRVEEAAFELVREDDLGQSERGHGGFGHTGR